MPRACPPDLARFRQYLLQPTQRDEAASAGAETRNAQLTKPPGALGRLEQLAVWYAGWRGTPRPTVAHPQIVIFAGNHGIAARGVSAFPAEVTAQMVANFNAGGAAINQLAQTFGARLDIHALDLDHPTADFTRAPAMDGQEFLRAIQAGWSAVDPSADLLIAGEMGIGNTTSAAAVATALCGGDPADWVGHGSGVGPEGARYKASVVAEGLTRHKDALDDPLEVLRRLGGREMAAIAGAIAGAREHRVPVILDGYICTAAAAVLHAIDPRALEHCVAGHLSDEHAHGRLLDWLGQSPLLDLSMRLGEGSGAALAIGVLRGAVACHSGMATFAEAGVAEG